jgi:hypothetical protein
MRLVKLIPAGALALAFTVGGCGDSLGTNTITLTQAESGELIAEIFGALGSAGVAQSRTATGLSLSLIPGPSFNAMVDINVSVNCGTGPGAGGTINVKGTDTPGTTETFNVTETFTACHTTNFVLDGSITFSGSGNSTSGTATVKGSLTVTGTKSGLCVIDFTLTSSANVTTASGTICGVAVAANQFS